MSDDFDVIKQYFRDRRIQAVRDNVDAHRALRGDVDAARRLLLSLDISVTDEQAATATAISELVDL